MIRNPAAPALLLAALIAPLFSLPRPSRAAGTAAASNSAPAAKTAATAPASTQAPGAKLPNITLEATGPDGAVANFSTPAMGPGAAPLAVEEIVQRASAQFEKKPKKLVCTVQIKAMQLESDGKPKETQESELTETWIEGIADQGIAYKRTFDGKPLDDKEMAKANEQDQEKRVEMKEHESKGEGGNVDPPIAGLQVPKHKFALLRQETFEGRPAYVLSVAPVSSKLEEKVVTRAGTLVIDAQTFALLHAETHAQPLPKHVDTMLFDEGYGVTAQGESVPKSLNVEVKGGVLFFTRRFKVESKWLDCK